MSKYHTQWDDFSLDTIGTNAYAWTQRSGASSYAPAYGSLSTVAIKRRYMALTNTAAGFVAVSIDALDSDANRANFDIVTCFDVDTMTAEQGMLIGRGQGSFNGGVLLNIIKSGTLRIEENVGSPSANSVIATTAVTLTSGKRYFAHFQGFGANLKGRVWDAALGAAGEPATWDVTGTTGVLAAGWLGLGCYHSTLAAKVFPANFFAVGTGGDLAPVPITDAEYTNWLDGKRVFSTDSMERCVLAEFSGIGYNPSPIGSPLDYTAIRKVYIANMGYTTKSWDNPPTRHYDGYIESIPTFSREMGVALSGQASVGFGDLVVRNHAKKTREGNILMTDSLDALMTDDGTFFRTI